MFKLTRLLLLAIFACFVGAEPLKDGVLFRTVSIMGETLQVPYEFIPSINKNVTTLLTAEKSQLSFVLNSALSVMKHSGGASAFAVLCVDCKDGEGDSWSSKGLQVIGSKALLDTSLYVFRADGPMPYTAVAESADIRRHPIHMLYREWIKANLLESGLSVLLVDIDVAFTSSIPFFTAKEDVVLEAHWPNDFRRDWYSFQFGNDVWAILNNGVALFTPTPAMLAFSRQFLGLVMQSVGQDRGFAQTSFVKHLHDLKLVLTNQNGHLVGKRQSICTPSTKYKYVSLLLVHAYLLHSGSTSTNLTVR